MKLRVLQELRKNDGMTLIEIMIVIAIIAIIGTLVVPNLMQAPQKARVTAAKQSINSLRTALLNHSLDSGGYPSTEDGLQSLVESGLLKNKDLNDPWGNPYQYSSPGEHDKEFDIWSYGADGKEGGEGFDADITSWE
jgi:general secretion pathway protein G